MITGHVKLNESFKENDRTTMNFGDDDGGDGGGRCRRIRTRIRRKRSGPREWWMRSSSILIVLSLPLFFIIWMNIGKDKSSCRRARYSSLLVDAAAANLKQSNVTNDNNETVSNTTISEQPSFAPSVVPSEGVPSDTPSFADEVDNSLPLIPPPEPELEPIPETTWTNLARQFFRIDVIAGPKTGIPSNAVQAVRIRANGTQNYQCQQIPLTTSPYDNGNSNGNTTTSFDGNSTTTTTSYEMVWVLRYPLANLWLYSTINGTVNMNRPPDGVHYAVGAPDESAGFANLAWDLGTDCHHGDPLYKKDKEGRPPSCSTYLGRWRGQNPTSDPQVGTIAFLRLDKDETKMNPTITVQQQQEGEEEGGEEETVSYYNALWQYSYMQRLQTFGGLVSTSGATCESTADINKTVSSVFEADFVLSLKQVAFPPGVSGDVRLPDDCFQAHPLYAQGYVDYENRNGTWVPLAGDEQQEQQQEEGQMHHPLSFTTLHAYSTVDYANKTPAGDLSEGGATSSQGQGPWMKVIPVNDGGVVGHNNARLLNASIDAITNNSTGGNTTIEDIFLSFDVGGGCNNSDRECQNDAGFWDGFFVSSEQQQRNASNLPLGLAKVSSKNANTSLTGIWDNILAPYLMVQQLVVRGGTAPPPPVDDGGDDNNNTDTNHTNSTTFLPVDPDINMNDADNDNLTTHYYRSEFNCSFVFALCVRDVQASTPVSSSSSAAVNTFAYMRCQGKCDLAFVWVVLFVLVASIIQMVC